MKNIKLPRIGVKTFLIIDEVDMNDFKNYTCKASNKYGLTGMLIKVQPKGNNFYF
jgi:hypothetical protein